MVFFVLTAALSGTFSNLLIPFKLVTRYGLRIHEYDFLLVVFHIKCNHDWFTLFEGPASSGWTIYPPLSAPQAIPGSGMG
jgi:cytochrome c oxidase subunit 1